jgi:selenocysteine lyase/cysteine desulfurase
LGGEEAIMGYCHDLAVKGGQVAADILGTGIMENSAGSLTVAMVNVELPLKNPTLSQDGVIQAFIDKLIFEHQCMAPVYSHNGKWYTRLSAQVYNDLDDFKVVANALKKVCQELETK